MSSLSCAAVEALDPIERKLDGDCTSSVAFLHFKITQDARSCFFRFSAWRSDDLGACRDAAKRT